MVARWVVDGGEDYEVVKSVPAGKKAKKAPLRMKVLRPSAARLPVVPTKLKTNLSGPLCSPKPDRTYPVRLHSPPCSSFVVNPR